MPRLDKRGRKIGYNWWRELVVSSWAGADQAWWMEREDTAMGYGTEEREYSEKHPRPTLKHFMISMADPNRYLQEPNDAS